MICTLSWSTPWLPLGCSDVIASFFGVLSVAVSCTHNCSMHGQCIDFGCFCEAGYKGKYCNQGDRSEFADGQLVLS